jgi:hypothetical protein
MNKQFKTNTASINTKDKCLTEDSYTKGVTHHNMLIQTRRSVLILHRKHTLHSSTYQILKVASQQQSETKHAHTYFTHIKKTERKWNLSFKRNLYFLHSNSIHLYIKDLHLHIMAVSIQKILL